MRREVVNAILYQARTGCAWRLLSGDLPPWAACSTSVTRGNSAFTAAARAAGVIGPDASFDAYANDRIYLNGYVPNLQVPVRSSAS
ncbi:MAG: transposase [Streptosporangiaceae bacterium]